MTIDAASVGMIAGAVGALGGWLTARTKRGEREDSAIARVLERRDEDCRRLTDRLATAQSEAQLHAGQIGDLAARAEAAIARCEEYADRVEKLEAENDECRSENRDLKARVSKLERERNPANVTPAYDTPAVPPRPQQLRPPPLPPMHESVGGYRHGK
jgi:chromosome segregation ATPase